MQLFHVGWRGGKGLTAGFMGLRLRLWSLSQVCRLAIDSSATCGTAAPPGSTFIFPTSADPLPLFVCVVSCWLAGWKGLDSGGHGAMIGVVEPEPGLSPDSSVSAWEGRPTRFHNSFFPPVLTPSRCLPMLFHVGWRGGKGLTAGFHGVTLTAVEPEPGSPPGD